jgi:hypothetical protein
MRRQRRLLVLVALAGVFAGAACSQSVLLATITDADGNADADADDGADADADADADDDDVDGGSGSADADDAADADVEGDASARTCVPGTCRYCDDPYYSAIGTQVCAADGSAWGPCRETPHGPPECVDAGVWYSPDVERCCVERGYCCQDMWDLDGDGDTWESHGACDSGGCAAPP